MDDYYHRRSDGSRSRSAGRDDRHRSRSKSERRKRKEQKHRKSRHRRRDEIEEKYTHTSSMSSYSSASSRSDRHDLKKRQRSKDSKKKMHKSKKRKHHKRKNSSRDGHSPNRSPSSVSNATPMPAAPPGARELADSLTTLFTLYPSMASIDEGGIPLLLLQLGRGTEYNLSQMPDKNLAALLEGVFQSLTVHGMELSTNGAWKWRNASGANNGGGNRDNRDDLALLRLTRALLKGVDVSLDTVQEYERAQLQQHLQTEQQHGVQQSQIDQHIPIKDVSTSKNGKIEKAPDEDTIKQKKRIERMASQLLDRFDRHNATDTSTPTTLANELQGICDVILEGESVQLDGIENAKLKASLSQLFELVGLELVEMEEEEEEEDRATNTVNLEMGYVLPDSDRRGAIASNLKEVLRVCRFRVSNGIEDAPTSWATTSNHAEETRTQSSDEDDGPAPLGTKAAAKASKRKQPQLANAASGGMKSDGGREEWMMVPGAYDFLKGISNSNFRGRTFKNSKTKSAAAPPVESINPEVLAEVHAIHQAYEQSRGPSLLDTHRQSKQQKQEDKQQEWKWNREKNLDDGRRVDKNALHMILGGASTELKSKFESGHGR